MEKRKNQLRRYAIIIPVCDENACLGQVLDELQQDLPDQDFVVAVGLNGSSDASGQVAVERGVRVGETELRGYGHGCMAAIEALRVAGVEVEAYLFYAGDGASRPRDVLALVQRFEATRAPLVIGLRSFDLRTWWQQLGRVLPNLILGVAGFFLTGRFYHDLGPLRLIEFEFFNRLDLRELTWGWTIEAEVKASVMGVRVETLAVVERERLAGEQKVSGVSLWRSACIGAHILLSGVRARWADD
ncbi:MAG: hypothetical protein L3J39_19160 [Verrucomicrobiales bacterium]|nr:hypothetical protein [Verrucomicrobiales bacterium]